MFRSLRFRLPALFLVGIAVSGLVAAVIALRLFQSYVLDLSKKELRREAIGLTELYQEQANKRNGAAPGFAAGKLEKATGDRLYFIGISPFPGSTGGLQALPPHTIDWQSNKRINFEFTPPVLRAHQKAQAPLRAAGSGPSFSAAARCTRRRSPCRSKAATRAR